MTPEILKQIANLAQLDITGQEEDMNNAIQDIFSLINELSTVDTQNIEPLNFPLDILQDNYQPNYQPLRADEACAYDIKNHIAINAPLSEDGFYLVPKVID
jgi:aspartyl-tRNA(Asn)/glutamyl-tRNA(Gln) amidotransferase subunit C